MDHETAVQLQAAERYVLEEFSPKERADFEEHFFGCPGCADEVRSATILAANTKVVLKEAVLDEENARVLVIAQDTPEQVRPMLTQALRHDGPALVEVRVSRQELSMPPTISAEQALGFSLYMIRAVINGRGDEVIDLARTNFFR